MDIATYKNDVWGQEVLRGVSWDLLWAAVIAGVIFFGVVTARNIKSDFIAGIVIAALFGLPFITISIAVGQSTVSPVLQILWLGLLFLAWGLALSLALVVSQ